MYEQRRNLILIMEHQTIPPSNHCARQGPMRQTIASNKECRTRRKEPDIDEVEDGHIVAQIEKEVVPCAFLVLVRA